MMSPDIPKLRTANHEFRGNVLLDARGSKLVSDPGFTITRRDGVFLVTFVSGDGMNRLTCKKVAALAAAIEEVAATESAALPLIISGKHNFSAGADLNEIRLLTGTAAFDFARHGQSLMNALESYPQPVIAAIEGHCMGGGLDLALACHRRIAAPHAVFGHRGAALGLITGWGGTQRLPRLIGKGRALELFVAAEKITASRALVLGLVDSVAKDPVAEALRQLQQG
jgi:enoyl-CoA hydratase/carnithine racemase